MSYRLVGDYYIPDLVLEEDLDKRSIKKIEYRDNTDRIEVERSFSLSKCCCGLGLIRTKLEETTLGAIGLSIFVTNLFKFLDRLVSLFLLLSMSLIQQTLSSDSGIVLNNALLW